MSEIDYARRSWRRLRLGIVRAPTLAVLLTAGLAGGCASEPPPRPARLDPANPAAPESPLPFPPSPTDTGSTTPSAPAGEHVGEAVPSTSPPAGGHDHHEAATPMIEASPSDGGGAEPADKTKVAPTVYACPMHPEVKSSKPGTCPKCGMQLQATKAEPPQAKPHKHAHRAGETP